MNTNRTSQVTTSSKNTTTTNNVVDFPESRIIDRTNQSNYTTKDDAQFTSQELLFHIYQNSSIYNSRNQSYNKNKDNKDNSKGGRSMSDINWQDKYLNNLDDSVKEINKNLINTENRISEMINKHIEYSTHLDKQRHEENLNLNNKIDTSINDISSKIDSTNKWIIGLVITTIIGVISIVVAALSAI
jgi:hypothetical protein